MNKKLFLLAVAVGVIMGVALVSLFIAHPWQLVPWINSGPLRTQEPAATQSLTPAGAPKDQVELLKEEIDGYSKKVDDLQRLLTLLVGFSTLYAIGLALNALKDAAESRDKLGKLLEEAEKIVAGARTEATEVREELLGMFPLFNGMSQHFEETLRTMLAILPTMDDSDSAHYHEPEPSERPQILFYEKTFAAAEYFNLKQFALQVSRIYQGLGSFYGLSARISRKKSDAETEPEKSRFKELYKDELQKARFYLEKSIKTNPGNTGALNDRAYLELTIAQATERQIAVAEQCCQDSIEVDPQQQRARYNLGWKKLIFDPKDLVGSIQLFREAKDKPNWQQMEPPRRIAEILYNKACALTRRAQESGVPADIRAKCLQEAMDDLEAAFARPDRDHKVLREAFCGADINPGGDLEELRNDPTLGARFEQLRKEICG